MLKYLVLKLLVINMQRKWYFIVLMVALALMASGCGEKDGETVTYEEDGVTVEANVPEGAEDQWCPVGSSWTASDPNTGEVYTMEIVGTEVIEGMEMCHAIYESNEPQEGISSVEYFWSENEENFMMTFYDSSENVISDIKMLDGTTTIIAEDGSVTVIAEDGTFTITDKDGTVTSFNSGN